MWQSASLKVSTKFVCMYQIFGPAPRQVQNLVQTFGPRSFCEKLHGPNVCTKYLELVLNIWY